MQKSILVSAAVLLAACGVAATNGTNAADAQTQRTAQRPRAAPAADSSWAGRYRGPAEEGGSSQVTITQAGGGYNVRLNVSTQGCIGMMQGRGVLSGNRMTVSDSIPPESGGGICEVTMTRRGRSLDVGEGPNCQYFHGAQCAFRMTVSRSR